MPLAKRVVAADSGDDVTDLLLDAERRYGVDARDLVAGWWAEGAGLNVRAWRDTGYPDISAGAFQQSLPYATMVPGMTLYASGHWAGCCEDTEPNKRRLRDYFYDFGRAVAVAAPQFARYREQEATGLDAWCRYNWPAQPPALNPNRGNYVRGYQMTREYAVSADVDEINQFDPSNYDTWAEYVAIDGAACSAASLAAVLNHYGIAANISEGLRRIRATGDDVTPELGLLNLHGQGEALASALDAAGIPSSTHPWGPLSRATITSTLLSGRPIICQMHNYLGRGIGHFLVLDGLLADGSGITVADSNAGRGKRFSYAWPTFWGEMAGGVAIWPDEAPAVTPPPDGTNEEGESMARIAELEAMVADQKGKIEGLTGAVAYLADDIADRVQALATVPITPERAQEARAITDEAQRVRVQFVGPRPPRAGP